MSRACHRPRPKTEAELEALRERLRREYPPPPGWSDWQVWRHRGGACLRCADRILQPDGRRIGGELRLTAIYPRVVVSVQGCCAWVADSPAQAWERIGAG